MYFHPNKMVSASFALAAAGIVACLAALFDNLVPKGSLLAFLVAVIPLGLAIAALLVGFTWLCDRLEDTLHGSKDKSAPVDEVKPTASTDRSGSRVRNDVSYHRITINFPESTRLRDRFTGNLHGVDQPRIANPPRAWHGQ